MFTLAPAKRRAEIFRFTSSGFVCSGRKALVAPGILEHGLASGATTYEIE